MDKIDKLLDAIGHPERYTPAEIEILLQDPETKEVFELLDKTKSSLQTISTPDIEEEWKKFEDRHNNALLPRRRWLKQVFTRNVAASIAIGIASFTAIAAMVGVGIHYFKRTPTITATVVKVKTEKIITDSQPDTASSIEVQEETSPAIIIFDNEPLETIITGIADFYDYKAVFNNEASKSLRLFFRWNQTDTIEEVIDRLNNFEQIHIVVNDKTIKVE